MLTRIDLRDFDGNVAERLPRPELPSEGPVEVVREILQSVKEFRRQRCGAISPNVSTACKLESSVVPPSEPGAALQRIDPLVRTALESAAQRIAVYHEAQMPTDVDVSGAGVVISGLHRPVRRAGCYVPGGRAAYPSTVLMTAIVARVAGVGRSGRLRSSRPPTVLSPTSLWLPRPWPVRMKSSLWGGAQAIGALCVRNGDDFGRST